MATPQSGQSTTETILLLPLYLLVTLGLLQIVQLGAALIMVNYGASSIAHKAVQADSSSVFGALAGAASGQLSPAGGAFAQTYIPELNSLLIAGMNTPTLRACIQKDTPITATLMVWTGAHVNTFPFVGSFLHAIFGSKYAGSGETGCSDNNELGPFYFSGDGTFYVVRGKAQVRLNYQPN